MHAFDGKRSINYASAGNINDLFPPGAGAPLAPSIWELPVSVGVTSPAEPVTREGHAQRRLSRAPMACDGRFPRTTCGDGLATRCCLRPSVTQ